MVMPAGPEPVKQISLRLPESLHARVKQLADRERRSLHAQILVMLERQADAGERR